MSFLPQSSFFTLSNMMSIARVLLVILGTVVLFSDVDTNKMMALFIYLIAGSTDYFDGLIARKFNQVSEWGMILDPLADKVSILIIGLSMLFLGMLPLWFILLIIVRDLLIVGGSVLLKSKTNEIPQAILIGKITVSVLAVTFITAFFDTPEITYVFIIISTVLLVLSLAEYVRIAMRRQKIESD